MKKSVLSLLLLLVLVFSMSTCAFATSFDYDRTWMERGESVDIKVYLSDPDAPFYIGRDKGLTNYDYENYRGCWTTHLTASYGADLGTHAYFAQEVTEYNSGYAIGYVFIVDRTAPQIYDSSKGKTSATISWDKTDVGRYQVQYRVKGGTWKTATDFTKKTSCKVTGLTKGKTYQFRVRAVNYDAEYWGEIYGYWSNTKSVKL